MLPRVSIQPEDFSEEEKLDRRDEIMSRNYPEQFETDPHVEVIAWVDSRMEHSDLIAECLREAGFPAEAGITGGITFDPGVPAAQRDALDEAGYICRSQYPLDPQYFPEEWTDDQKGLIYDYWDEYFIPCMEAHGHSISREDQPSRESFIATLDGPEPTEWRPSTAFDYLSEEEQESLRTVCPPDPPDEHLYGVG